MRLTSVEIHASKAQLSKWLTPAEMRAIVDGIQHRLGSKDMFNQSGLDFVRDAWTAGKFAAQREAEAVRLILEERPDFALQFASGNREAFELIEADVLGRERGREYRQPSARNAQIEYATPQQAIEVISLAARKKAARAVQLAATGKRYPVGTGLLIHLNLIDFGFYQSEIEAVFSDCVEAAKEWFETIWILWKDLSYRVV